MKTKLLLLTLKNKTMIDQFKKMIVAIIALSVVFAGCSKDDDGKTQVEENGGDVFRYQIVTIDFSNTELSENEYNATLGNLNITIIKTDENQLAFAVPVDVELGYTELVIPNLNHVRIKYNVLQPQLGQSAEETVSSLTDKFENFFTGISEPNLENTIALNNYNQFKNYLENNATTEQKKNIALYYQVNKEVVDSILFENGNIGSRTSELTSEEKTLILKFKASVLSLSIAAVGIWLGSPEIKLLGAAIASVGINKAKQYHRQLQGLEIKVINFSLDGEESEQGKLTQNRAIQLNSGELATLSFKIGKRKLLESDNTITESNISLFFSNKITFNNVIDTINGVITWLNTNIPFVSLSAFEHSVLSSDSTAVYSNTLPETTQNITFSVNHPNLQLVSATLVNNGQLNLQIKIIGTPTATSVISALNYSYSDEMSNFSGYFDINVNSYNPLIGNWILTNFDGYPMGVWDNTGCPRYRTVSGNITFTENSFSAQLASEDQGSWTDENDVTQCSTLNSGTEYFTGTYQNNSTNYTISNLDYSGSTVANIPNGHINVVDDNNIEILLNLIWDGEEPDTVLLKYTRQ